MAAEKFDSWQAELTLGYRAINGKTVLAEKKHKGPLGVQKSFYPEGDVCHNYILHPPGGVAGGDRLTINVAVEKNAHALITTPASNKFYNSLGQVSVVEQTAEVAPGAVMEWLPQDAIMFSGCRLDTKTKINLQDGAQFTGWEITCLGRPASNEKFEQGFCQQRFELWRENKPLYIERARLNGAGEMLTASWGMASFTVSGLMLVTGASKELLALARDCEQDEACLSAVTLKGDVMIVRYLGHQGMEAREYFTRVWSAIRPQLYKREACAPRIWFT